MAGQPNEAPFWDEYDVLITATVPWVAAERQRFPAMGPARRRIGELR